MKNAFGISCKVGLVVTNSHTDGIICSLVCFLSYSLQGNKDILLIFIILLLTMQVSVFPEIRILISIYVFSILSLHVGLNHPMLFGLRKIVNDFSNSSLYDCHR